MKICLTLKSNRIRFHFISFSILCLILFCITWALIFSGDNSIYRNISENRIYLSKIINICCIISGMYFFKTVYTSYNWLNFTPARANEGRKNRSSRAQLNAISRITWRRMCASRYSRCTSLLFSFIHLVHFRLIP